MPRMRRVSPVYLCALLVLVFCGPAIAAPEVGAIARTWQLDFEFYDPQRITVPLAGEAAPATYWYLFYKVTNNTGRDVEFFPSFRLVTDTLDVVVGGEQIGTQVYDAIAARHDTETAFFAPPSKVTGPLLQGEENARVSAAVFRMFDLEASGFSIYVSGLSGDVERVTNPAASPAPRGGSAEPEAFILRRTLALHYDLPGDPVTRAEATAVRRNREWVMR